MSKATNYWYKLTPSEDGNVRDKYGKRYHLHECGAAYTPQGLNVGYLQFPTRSEALAHYGVEEIPEAELYPQAESES